MSHLQDMEGTPAVPACELLQEGFRAIALSIASRRADESHVAEALAKLEAVYLQLLRAARAATW